MNDDLSGAPVGTLTRLEYDEARKVADEVHVVRPQPRAGGDAE